MSTDSFNSILKNRLFINGLYDEQRNDIKKLILKAEILNDTEAIYKINEQILKVFSDYGIIGSSNCWETCGKCTYHNELEPNEDSSKCSLVSACIELGEILIGLPTKPKSERQWYS